MKTTSTNRQRGDRDEQRIARKFGGTVVDGSGSSAEKKGDVRVGKFLVQAKSARADSLPLKRKDLEAIQEQSLNMGRRPAFIVTSYRGEEPLIEWIAFPTWMLTELGIDLKDFC